MSLKVETGTEENLEWGNVRLNRPLWALKVEGTLSQGMWQPPEAEGKEMDSSLQLSEEIHPCQYLDFSPSVSDF